MFRKKINEVLQGENELVKRVSIPVETPRLATDEEIREAKKENELKTEARRRELDERKRVFQSIRHRHGLGVQKTKEQIWQEGRVQLIGFINKQKNQIQILESALLERDNEVQFLRGEIESIEKPEQEIKKIKSEFEAEVKGLKISISEKQDQLQRAVREKEIIEDKFRDLLLSKELLDRDDLNEKSAEFLLELWQEKSKLLSPKKDSENEENSDDYPSNENVCEFCGKSKHQFARECENCSRLINNIRMREKISKLEAREIYRRQVEDV